MIKIFPLVNKVMIIPVKRFITNRLFPIVIRIYLRPVLVKFSAPFMELIKILDPIAGTIVIRIFLLQRTINYLFSIFFVIHGNILFI